MSLFTCTPLLPLSHFVTNFEYPLTPTPVTTVLNEPLQKTDNPDMGQ